MYATIFKIAWPYLQRFLADKAVEYLNERRELRPDEVAPEPAPAPADDECLPCPPCPPAETEASTENAIWFSLSGILLGSALSVILYLLLQDEWARAD